MAVGVAKVKASSGGIANVVIRHIVPNVVSAIAAEVQCVVCGMELHADYVPSAYSRNAKLVISNAKV